jgi:hypothetical protein
MITQMITFYHEKDYKCAEKQANGWLRANFTRMSLTSVEVTLDEKMIVIVYETTLIAGLLK